MKRKWKTKLFFILNVAVIVVMQLFSVCLPLSIQNLINNAVDLYATEMSKLSIYVIKIVVIAFSISLMGILQQIFTTLYSNELTQKYRVRISNYISSLSPVEFYKKENTDYVSIYNNNISTVVNSYYIQILNIVECACVIVFSVGALFSINVVLGLIIIVSSLLPMITPMLLGRKLGTYQNNILSETKKYNSLLMDMLAGFDLGKGYGIERKLKSRMSNQGIVINKAKLKYQGHMQVANLVSSVLGYGGYIALITVGVIFICNGKLAVGGLFAAVSLSDLIAHPMVMISHILNEIKATKKVKIELDSLCSDEDEAVESVDNTVNSVELRHISYAYSDKKVIDDLSLKIESNKKYMIVGESGCGKSTLLKIIAGNINPDSGDKMVGNCLIEKNKYMGCLVFQNPVLLTDSIENNITLYKSYEKEKIDEAIEFSNLKEVINSLGVDSEIENGGYNFSGGEKQRISLARAIITQPGMLLLDEATSALDPRNYMDIEKKILEKNMTVLNVCHKFVPEIAKEYDEIIFMKNGKIELMDSYNNLLNNQAFCQYIGA